MSIRVPGYRFPAKISSVKDLADWQNFLRQARDHFEKAATLDSYQWTWNEAVLRADNVSFGLDSAGKAPLTEALAAYRDNVKAKLDGRVSLLSDTEVTLFWSLHEDYIYVILFGDSNFFTQKVATYLQLEDYHYQNSTDDYAGCTEEEWAQRKETWKEILTCGKRTFVAPRETMSSFVVSPKRTRTLIWTESAVPKLEDPTLESRVKKIAKRVMNERHGPGKFATSGQWFSFLTQLERDLRPEGVLYPEFTEVMCQVKEKIPAVVTPEYLCPTP